MSLRSSAILTVFPILFSISTTVLSAPKKLSEARSQIKFPTYSMQEKLIVATQAHLLLNEQYVNLDKKIESYGPLVDPRMKMDEILSKATTLSDYELHSQLGDLFRSQRDLHLNYKNPKPYQCHYNVLPFRLDSVIDQQQNKRIAILQMRKTGLKDVDELVKDVQKGDIILSYNGKPIEQAIQEHILYGAGANEDGAVLRAIDQLVFRYNAFNLFPKEDEVTLQMKKRDGSEYTITVPWVTIDLPKCLSSDSEGNWSPEVLYKKQYDDGSSNEQMLIEDFYGDKNLGAIKYRESKEPELRWGVLENEYGRFGYLRLKSFSPKKLSGSQAIPYIAGLVSQLMNKDKVDGLIWDVRNNGGGSITFSQGLLQLFTPEFVQPQQFRLLNTPFNHLFMEVATKTSSGFEKWNQLLKDVRGSEERYTARASFRTPKDQNRIGQYFYAPIAVLTNARCYSACDMFTGGMQDMNGAKIFGETKRTGAGGANVVGHSFFYGLLERGAGNSAPMVKLPGGQDFRTAWRQTIRTGKNDGKLIEDDGIVADRVILKTISDMYTEDHFLLGEISKELVTQKKSQPYKTHFPKRNLRVVTGNEAKFEATTTGTELLTVYHGENMVISKQLPAGQPSTLEAPNVSSLKPGHYNFGYYGYAKDKVLWNSRLNVEVLPKAITLPAGKKLEADFEIGTGPFNIFSLGPEGQGWQIVDGTLRTHKSGKYVDNLITEASVRISGKNRPALKVSFDLSGKTELNYDYFSVEVSNDDGSKRETLKRVSGELKAERVELKLEKFAGENVQIYFLFESDEGTVDTGVIIDNITIQ